MDDEEKARVVIAVIQALRGLGRCDEAGDLERTNFLAAYASIVQDKELSKLVPK